MGGRRVPVAVQCPITLPHSVVQRTARQDRAVAWRRDRTARTNMVSVRRRRFSHFDSLVGSILSIDLAWVHVIELLSKKNRKLFLHDGHARRGRFDVAEERILVRW